MIECGKKNGIFKPSRVVYIHSSNQPPSSLPPSILQTSVPHSLPPTSESRRGSQLVVVNGLDDVLLEELKESLGTRLLTCGGSCGVRGRDLVGDHGFGGVVGGELSGEVGRERGRLGGRRQGELLHGSDVRVFCLLDEMEWGGLVVVMGMEEEDGVRLGQACRP